MIEFTTRFDSAVDLRRVLEEAEIEYIDVSETRVVALVEREVVQLVSEEGPLERTTTIDARVWETRRSQITDAQEFSRRLKRRLERARRRRAE